MSGAERALAAVPLEKELALILAAEEAGDHPAVLGAALKLVARAGVAEADGARLRVQLDRPLSSRRPGAARRGATMSRDFGVDFPARESGRTLARRPPTHIVTVTSKSGRRVNPLTYGSAAWRTCYGLVDLGDRLAAIRDPDLEVSVERLPEPAPRQRRRPS